MKKENQPRKNLDRHVINVDEGRRYTQDGRRTHPYLKQIHFNCCITKSSFKPLVVNGDRVILGTKVGFTNIKRLPYESSHTRGG